MERKNGNFNHNLSQCGGANKGKGVRWSSVCSPFSTVSLPEQRVKLALLFYRNTAQRKQAKKTGKKKSDHLGALKLQWLYKYTTKYDESVKMKNHQMASLHPPLHIHETNIHPKHL